LVHGTFGRCLVALPMSRFFYSHHPPGGGVRTLRNAAKPVKGQVDLTNAHLSRVGQADARVRGFARAEVYRRRGLGWNGNRFGRIHVLEPALDEDQRGSHHGSS